MNTNKLISIIVPVYNVEKYLTKSVNSILNQTYKNLEIILVDDGAKDSSGKMCDELKATDNRIKVIHKANGGLSSARNAGLKVATGDYIGYVDSDDWIEPDMYEKLYHACEDNNAEVAICRYFQEYKDKTVGEGKDSVTVFNQSELIKAYVEDNDEYVIYNSVWSKLYRRDIVDGVEFPEGRNSEDIMYTTRAFCKANKGVYVDTPLYHYVIDRDGSIMNADTSVNTDRMFNDEIPFWREHIACIKANVSGEMGDLSEYYFYRRMLSYFVDLYKNNPDAAKKIADMLKKEKHAVLNVYNRCFKSKGDLVRMKCFLKWPKGYYCINWIYLRLRGVK